MADRVSEQYLQCPGCEQFSVTWRTIGVVGREMSGYWCEQCKMTILPSYDNSMQERSREVYRLLYGK